MFTPLIASLLFAQQAASPAGAPAAAPPPPCASEAHSEFDFWVGEWEVFPNGSDTKVANSSIARMHNGCAVREHWQPLRGGGGSSLNSLDPVTGRWHQTWVGSGGGRVEFVGAAVAGGIVLQGFWPNIGGPGKDGLVRMTYKPNPDGSVRQHGEASFDEGLTWATSFDLIYRPRTAQ